MKIVSMVIVFLLVLSSQALAIAPINLEAIKEAHSYGRINSSILLEDFLRPWTTYEEKAVNLSSTSEHAYLYTAFLLMATDAREKTLNGTKINLQDSEKILSDYAGTLSFSVMILGEDTSFTKNTSVFIKQEKKILKPYQVIIPTEAEKASWQSGNLFLAQCYFYFSEKEVILNQPVNLVIITGDKKEHHFYFDLDKIK